MFLASELRKYRFSSHDLAKVEHGKEEWKYQVLAAPKEDGSKPSYMIFRLQHAAKDKCIYAYKHGITVGASECPANLFAKNSIYLVKNSIIR